MISPSVRTEEPDLTMYLKVIKRRKWLIILPLLIIMPLISLMLLIQEPLYKSTSTLLIDPERPAVANVDEALNYGANKDNINFYMGYYETQYRLIKSDALLEKVLEVTESQQVAKSPAEAEESSWIKTLFVQIQDTVGAFKEFCTTALKSLRNALVGQNQAPAHTAEAVERWTQMNKLREAILIEPEENTRLVHVSMTGLDPYLITTQVNTLAELYIAQNLGRKLGTAGQASTWLKQEVERLQASLQEAEQALQRLVEKQGFVSADLEKRQNIALEGFSALNAAYLTTRTERVGLETRLNELRRLSQQPIAKRQFLALSVPNPTLDALQRRYVELESKIANLSEVYKSKHPRILEVAAEKKQVQNEIELEIKKAIANTESEYRSIVDKERELENSLKRTKNEVSVFDKNIVEYLATKSNVDSKRALYEDMLRRLNETDVTKGLENNNMRIVQPAVVPVVPMSAQRMLKLVLSLGLSLAMGLGLAFLAEILDKRFKSPSEAEHVLRLPFLGLIPYYRIDARDRQTSLLPWQQARSFIADAYRNVRTNLQFFAAQQPLRSLLITSAVAEEGKSTTVVNLGIAFAQLGKAVLLVDADLHRPTLHQFFHLPNDHGLSDILIHGRPWHHLVVSTPLENLQVLTSGPTPYNPTELLSTTRMKTLLEHLKEAFDIVIYETPMVLSVPDAAVVSAAMDGVLLVHNPARGNKEVVMAAKQVLERARANIVGLIFNAVEVRNMTELSSRYYDVRESMIHAASLSTDNPAEPPAHTDHASRLVPVSKTRVSDGMAITIHRLLCERSVDHTEAEPGSVFLIADVEVSNTLDISVPFYTSSTAIYRKNLNKYGQALSKIYAMEDKNPSSREEDIFQCEPSIRSIDNGLQDEELIPAHSTRRGLIVYKIPQGSQHCMFMYEHDSISVTIPLVIP